MKYPFDKRWEKRELLDDHELQIEKRGLQWQKSNKQPVLFKESRGERKVAAVTDVGRDDDVDGHIDGFIVAPYLV